jgi:hypothetical protein
MLRTQTRTEQQKTIVEQLVKTFGIDGSKVLFLNPDKPTDFWLRGKTLAQIARQSGKFKVIRVEHEKVIEIGVTRQAISQGTVVDLEDRIYSYPGVATFGERIPETEEQGDAWDLADARALRSTLDLAGFDPLDPTSVVPLNGKNGNGEHTAAPRDPVVAEAAARVSDFARIKILSREKGLIAGKDASGYRKFLATNYDGAVSAAGFDPVQRKSLIATLEAYQPSFDPKSMPLEFLDLEEAEGAPV